MITLTEAESAVQYCMRVKEAVDLLSSVGWAFTQSVSNI